MASEKTGLANGEVDGFKELSAKFKELASSLSEDELIQAALGVGRSMQKNMRQRIRNKTGNLSKGIVVKKFKKPGTNFAFVATNYGVAPHAHNVEFGHGGIHPAPANPFFRPTVDEFKHNGELEREVGKAVKKVIEKAAK